VCGTVCSGFGGVSVCCVWDSVSGFGGVSVCCVWDSMVWVWCSEFVSCVGQFVAGLGE